MRLGRRWTFVKENLTVVLTITGLLVYASLRLSAGLFYGRLGFTPEDVGLGYAEILARSLYTLILLTVYGGLLLVVLLWIAGGLRFVAQRSVDSLRGKNQRSRERQPLATYGKKYLSAWPILTAIAVLGLPIYNAALEADAVQDGRPVRQSDWVYPFAWDAPAARVTRAGSEAGGGRCMIYLGNAGGFVAVYDPTDGSSWRLPTSGTIVQTGGPLADIVELHSSSDCTDGSLAVGP